jgi:hypothetical protein
MVCAAARSNVKAATQAVAAVVAAIKKPERVRSAVTLNPSMIGSGIFTCCGNIAAIAVEM